MARRASGCSCSGRTSAKRKALFCLRPMVDLKDAWIANASSRFSEQIWRIWNTLSAEELVYDLSNHVVTASGDVVWRDGRASRASPKVEIKLGDRNRNCSVRGGGLAWRGRAFPVSQRGARSR